MTDPEKLKAILNLACVVMSRKSTPAMKAEAEELLSDLDAPEYEPDLLTNKVKTWH